MLSTFFLLFVPGSPIVWVLLSTLLESCLHLPLSIGPFLLSVPWTLPVQPLLLHQGKNVAENKASHFADQLLHLITVLPHRSGCWHISGVGGHREARADEAVHARRKICGRLCMRICAQGMTRLRNHLSLVIAMGVSFSQITSPALFSPCPHKCYPNYFIKRYPNNSLPKISLLPLWLSFGLHFKSTRDFIAPGRHVFLSSMLKMSPFALPYGFRGT